MNIRKQLEKMTETGDYTQAMDLLQRLTDIDMNLSILTNTRIGYQVNALRKSTTDSEVISQANPLLKCGKSLSLKMETKRTKKTKMHLKMERVKSTMIKIHLHQRKLVTNPYHLKPHKPQMMCAFHVESYLLLL